MCIIHTSKLRNAFAGAASACDASLFGWDSGAFELDFDEWLDAMGVDPITLNDLDDPDDPDDLDMSQFENGEWYWLDDIESNAENAFDSFVDDPSGIIFPQRVADIERIFDQNKSEVEQAFAKHVDLSEANSIFDIIASAVNYAVRDAYRVDLEEFCRVFMVELDQADPLTA